MKGFFLESKHLTLQNLSNIFKLFVLEYNLVITRIYFFPIRKPKLTCAIVKLPPKRLAIVKEIVSKHDVIKECFNKQTEKRVTQLKVPLKFNYTDEWFKSVEEVQIDAIQHQKLGGGRVRATYINNLLRNGAPIQHVAKQVGHKSLQSTNRYAPKLKFDQILDQYKKSHPKA